jgi:hypothetical protein
VNGVGEEDVAGDFGSLSGLFSNTLFP